MPATTPSNLRRNLKFVAGAALVVLVSPLLRMGLRKKVDGWRRGAGLVLRGEQAMFVLSAFGLTIDCDENQLCGRLAQFLAGETEFHRRVRRKTHEYVTEICDGPTYSLAFQPYVDGPGRFVRPDSWAGKTYGVPPDDHSARVLLNFVVRANLNGTADIWVRVNHVGADGVPTQEMLARLETAWGVREPVVYPTPQEFAAHFVPLKCAGREELVEVHGFFDFSPLIAWRTYQNSKLPEPMALSAAFLWCLMRHEAFAGLIIGTTVEIPPVDEKSRGVGVAVVRPHNFFHRKNGLAEYVKDFNRKLALTRVRRSSGTRMIDAAALIPAGLENELLRRGLEQGRWAFGSIALSVIKDAKVFVAPIADFGHADGFLGLGSVNLPTADGRKVGCITIKGPPARISGYPSLIEEVLRTCRAELP